MDDLSQIRADLGSRFALHISAIHSEIDQANIHVLWQDLAARYSETQRAYHTLSHLQQLFGQFEKIKHHLYEPNIIALGLYYHDVIYEPQRSDNELKSAEYAVNALHHYLDATQCQHIYALIMMTTSHQRAKLASHKKNSDAAFLLDMDLSVLAAPWHEYQQYAQAIRQEYQHVAPAEYQAGRVALLKGLLTRPRLYLSDYYYKRLEMPARDNLKREIISLAS